MIDRYTKTVLTVIAAALLYLCVVISPLPSAHAQGTQRPGEMTGPVQAVIVGWRAPANEAVPVELVRPAAVTVNGLVEVRGSVTTERSAGAADRVVLVGWEERAIREKPGALQAITKTAPGIPVVQK
jgi:hypothetical protein